jgi:hypothetical protein
MFRCVISCLSLFSIFAPAALWGQGPRVHLEASRSWTLNGWSPFTGLVGALGGGDRPQTVEILHTFTKRCPQVVLTRERENSDFVVLVEREGGKNIFRKDNKYAVFSRSGELLKAGSTRMLSSAVSGACDAITAEAGARVPEPEANARAN